MKTVKICSPYIPGLTEAERTSDEIEADEVATTERVDNLRIQPMRSGGFRPRAAVERMKLWNNGRVIKVTFLDGIPEIQARVESIAKEWEQLANLRLQFVRGASADIRISFAQQGFSWSTVGTDALTVRNGRATMNYGWLDLDTAEREYQRVVRHEFGHALGMIHEHQNPAASGKIPWDKPKVYEYYARQDWSHADVDNNIFDLYDEDSTNYSAFDPTSIMQYAVPDSLTIGSYAIGWNTEFSPTDKSFMGRQYPRAAAGTTELNVGDHPLTADLSVAGEVDTYHFVIKRAGRHIMSTNGPTDTVLALHGPNDPGAIMAWDDDRGRGLNAKIARRLQPGEYWLTVRHKQPHETGNYTVGIR